MISDEPRGQETNGDGLFSSHIVKKVANWPGSEGIVTNTDKGEGHKGSMAEYKMSPHGSKALEILLLEGREKEESN
jgi:hypothetical protein